MIPFADAPPTISQAVANLLTAITPSLVVILGAVGSYVAWKLTQGQNAIKSELRANTDLTAKAAIAAAVGTGDAGQIRSVNAAVADMSTSRVEGGKP